ncbi:MAG: pilus assembly PilX N-terminal domain-containing protein [bacterium]|nr:pilus assembly PilX N-terminal domain-containing protein [bacterium]
MKKFTVYSLQFTEWTRRVFRCQLSTVNCQPRERGFTLLLAALVSSVVLALGVSIFEIALKQVSLSSMGRESQFAFYAADTGAECALYWDVRWNYFATTTPSSVVPPQPKCATQSLNALGRPTSPTDPYTMTFQFDPSNKCAQVSIKKCAAVGLCDPENPQIHTVIHADGFNTSCATISTSARALQRSVEIQY